MGSTIYGTALETEEGERWKCGGPGEIPEGYSERIRLFIASTTEEGQPVFWVGQLGRTLHHSEWEGADLTGGIGANEEEGLE